MTDSTRKYWQVALWLAIITIFYNILEGLVSIYFRRLGRDPDPVRLRGGLVHRGAVRRGHPGHGAAHPPEPGHLSLAFRADRPAHYPARPSTSWPSGWA